MRGALITTVVALVSRAAFVAPTERASAADEGPNLKLTSVSSSFIPYETDAQGACSGPFIDFKFVITNFGSDFPRPSDLQANRNRMIGEPEATMLYFNIYADMDFGAGPGSGGQQ